jgi:parallel beta-helix repeat protein
MTGTRRTVGTILALVAGAASTAFASPAYAMPSTVYVGGIGCSDTGPGSQTTPFCTIKAAAAVATAGTTVVVAPGTYRESVAVKFSGAAGSPVVFRADTTGAAVVTGGITGFTVSSLHDVIITGFRITGTSSHGISVSSSTGIVISDNMVTNAGQQARGMIAAGIRLSGTTGSTITGNTADHNSDTGIYLGAGSSGNTVSANEASWNANGFQRNANGINVVASGNTIVGNVLHDNEDSGLQFYTGGNDNLAALNVTYSNGDHGIDNLNVTSGRLIGNTVYRNCTTGINVEGTSGNYLIENNIVVDNAVYPAYNGISCSRRAGNIGVWDSAPPTTTANRNLVWLTKSGTMYVWGSSYTSMAAMRQATGQEKQGIEAAPRFADAAAGDLALVAGSPAIDRADSGAPGAQAQDLPGRPRVDDPATANLGAGPRSYDDLGAYEFQPTASGPAAPTAVLAVSPSSGTAPLMVTADASGSSDPQGGSLSYSFAFGDGGTVGPQAGATATHTYAATGTFPVTVTVSNTAGDTATTTQTVTVTPATAAAPAYISQIATNFGAFLTGPTRTTGSLTVWRTEGVRAGDLIVLTLALTGTAAGAVTATDSAGDAFTVAADVADGGGNRLVVLSGIAATGLATNDRITVTHPGATSYRLTGDEAAGVTTTDRQAGAAGTTSTFDSGSTGTTTVAAEFVVAAVGSFDTSTAAAWSNGWKSLTPYANGTTSLGRAYQTVGAADAFRATGTTSGRWLAVCATFRTGT